MVALLVGVTAAVALSQVGAGSGPTTEPRRTAPGSPTSDASTDATPTPPPSATAQAPPSAPPTPGSFVGALTTLASLDVKGRAPQTGYERVRFGPSWADVDRNGCDTRNDILARDLTGIVQTRPTTASRRADCSPTPTAGA